MSSNDGDPEVTRVGNALRAGPVLPPPDDIHPTGDGDYFAIGLEFLGYFIDAGGLTPRSQVLEIGSGLGRMALPLAHYLDDGRYLGLEVSRPSVEWCTQNISAPYPKLAFAFHDIHHPMYNPNGRIRIDKQFQLPLPDELFDFVFLTSVFTHLRRFEVKKYLSECRRLLRPGGRLFATFYLAPSGDTAEFESLDTRFRFTRNSMPSTHVSAVGHPLSAVAYDKEFILGLLWALGFTPDVQVYEGSWNAGRAALGSYQDIIVASRPGQRSHDERR